VRRDVPGAGPLLGVSIGYALGAILGGAFAPTIAEILVRTTGSAVSVGVHVMVLCVVPLVAVSLVPEPRGTDPGGGDGPVPGRQLSGDPEPCDDRGPVHGQVHGAAAGQTGVAVTTMLST
jgi:hypothetical protein